MEEQGITELSQGMHSIRMLVVGEDAIEDKADHNLLKTLWVDLPLWGGRSAQESNQGSYQLTLIRGSREGNRPV